MKLSKLWLREWVNFDISEKQLAEQLTMAGLEVDAVLPVAGEFEKVIVAKVVQTRPHPNADKLTICEVSVNGDQPLQVVCGAANVRAELKVALAMIGATLPGGFKIKESKLRGELSQGMLCSASELGLAEDSEGIIELDDDAPVGVNLREYLSLDDQIIDIDLTPNRADCFSVLGVAREIAILNHLPLTKPKAETIKPVIDDQLKINILASNACTHYCSRVIRGIDSTAKTPLWMTERLRRSGIRSIHPVVDVLNYVMIEFGQPMHAFDLAKINKSLNVRFGTDSEHLQLLNGQNIQLNSQVLVIADAVQPLAIAGVMGGLESGVSSGTQDICLESAFFNPVVIAGVARKYSLFSDSSQRFERGVDPKLQIHALERATGLIIEIAGGKAGAICEEFGHSELPKPASILFNTDKVMQLTGVQIPLQEIKRLLHGLEVVIEKEQGCVLEVSIPMHRFDLNQDVDLVEEIIRLYGYNNIQAAPMFGTVKAGAVCFHENRALSLSHWLKAKGYHETISYSFVDPELQEIFYPEKQSMQLLNPISSELSQMRMGMWPGLIASMIHNIHRQQQYIKFFEIGVVFDVIDQQVYERHCIAGLLSGIEGESSWNETTREFDFYDLKGDIEALVSSLKIDQLEFIPNLHNCLHPGQSAQIFIKGEPAGWLGALHPRLADALDLQQNVLLFELDMDALKQTSDAQYQSISKYPQIRRDLSFLIDKDIDIAKIESAIRVLVPKEWYKKFAVFDVYTGTGVPENKKSLAISLILQDANRTLIDSEINSLISAIIKSLEKDFSIILRE